MNFYEFGLEALKNRGMFDNQAKAVMDKVVFDSENNPDSIHSEMRNRWSDNIDGYPPMMKNVVFMGIEPFALEYIKENCPEAWFRPIFDKEHPVRKEFENDKENHIIKGKLKDNLRKGHGEIYSIKDRNVEIVDKEDHPIYGRRYKVKGYDDIWFEKSAFEYIDEEYIERGDV